ncbi:MAG: bleomycin resistance family protein [Flavobacteriaceae bacterium]|nr:MAG: bleomycin resistance family protein [Flavobacteriaceae bacterium]
MKFQPILPIIWTNELDKTVDFYCNVLGFSYDDKVDNSQQWFHLFRDECEIVVASPEGIETLGQPGFSGTFYIMVDNIDELWYSIKDKAEVCSEIETFEWGMREFAIFDNNGYSFQFAQDMTQFL